MLRFSTGLLAAAALTLALTGCTQSTNEVAWQDNGMPLHTQASSQHTFFKYVYYPSNQVYYEPYTNTWHWFEQERWHTGQQRPEQFSFRGEEPRIVHTASNPPYRSHQTAVAMHGPFYNAHPASTSPRYADNRRLIDIQRRVAKHRPVIEKIELTPKQKIKLQVIQKLPHMASVQQRAVNTQRIRTKDSRMTTDFRLELQAFQSQRSHWVQQQLAITPIVSNGTAYATGASDAPQN
jgi:hypothetical protein